MQTLVRTGNGLPNQFHPALRTDTLFLRGYVFVHWAYIVELRGLFDVSRAFLLCCRNDVERVHSGTDQKQCDSEERQYRFQEAHFFNPVIQALSCSSRIDEQEERR